MFLCFSWSCFCKRALWFDSYQRDPGYLFTKTGSSCCHLCSPYQHSELEQQ